MFEGAANVFKPEFPNWERRQYMLVTLINKILISKAFIPLKTDKERITHVLKELLKLDKKYWCYSTAHPKSTPHSAKLRDDGNKSFGEDHYDIAVKEYTESVIYAPNSYQLASAYANRSAALFKLKKYEECLVDVDRALNLDYPDILRSKLLKRKGLCLARLGSSEAKSAFQEALIWLEKMTLNDDQMVRTKSELEHLISCRPAVPLPPQSPVEYPVTKILAPNPVNPNVSDAVAIQYSEKFGRHLVATRKIEPGELLISEEPYCSRLKCAHIYSYCSHCLQESWNLIPCTCCVYVAYCTEACRDQAWNEYHELACPTQGMMYDFKYDGFLSLSTKIAIIATQKGTKLDSVRKELEEVDRNTDPRTMGFTDDGQFVSDRYRSVYTLSRAIDESNTLELIKTSLTVAVTVCALACETTMFGKKLALDATLLDNPDVILIGELILRHMHIISINANSYVTLPTNLHESCACGILPFCSLLNHSCDPNTVRKWDGDRLKIYSVYPIKEGEQIFDNYGTRYSTMKKKERQERVKNWNFICECRPCAEDWTQLEDMHSYKEQRPVKKGRKTLDKMLRQFRLAYRILLRRNSLESLMNVMDVVRKTVAGLINLVELPCKELCILAFIIREYHWAGNALIDHVFGRGGPVMKAETFEFYKVLQEMEDYLSDYKLNFVSGLANPYHIALSLQCKNEEELYDLALKIVLQNSAVVFDDEYEQKNSGRSVRCREDGDQFYMDGVYYSAIREYTESIVYGNTPAELALAYANRAAALYELEKFEACIRDIDRVLSLKHPDNLKSMLYKKKASCMRKLGRSGVPAVIKKALTFIDKMDLSEAEMEQHRCELTMLSNADIPTVPQVKSGLVDFKVPDPEIRNPSPEIPSASDAVGIVYTEELGRHLVATRNIKPGELLVLEKPYCMKLNPKNLYTHCAYCLQVSWDLIPCRFCVNVAYCSQACKDKAWDEYHEIECPVMIVLHEYRFNIITCLSMRIALIATRKGSDLDKIKEELLLLDQTEDPRLKGFSDDGKFCSDQFRSFYSLKSDLNVCGKGELLVRALVTTIIVCMMARETKMFKTKLTLDTLASNPDVKFFAVLILKNVYRVWLNTHSFGAVRSATELEHGDTAMCVFGLLNHSCDANTFTQCYKDSLGLYAAYPIQQGEQIFSNYGPRFTVSNKIKRQEFLARYYFTCDCPACKGDWPTLAELPSYKTQEMTTRSKNTVSRLLRRFCAEDRERKSMSEFKELAEMIELIFKHTQRPCLELTLVLSMMKNYFQEADTVFDFEPGRVSKIKDDRMYLHKALANLV